MAMTMTMTTSDKNEYKYQCPDCGMWYKTPELAEACEKWCTEHKSCNLDIIKQGILGEKPEGN